MTLEAPTSQQERSLVTALPERLQPYRDALGAGLFYLAIGKPAPDLGDLDAIPRVNCKSTRCTIHGRAVDYLRLLAARYGSERQAVINALAWVEAQPEAERKFFSRMTF